MFHWKRLQHSSCMYLVGQAHLKQAGCSVNQCHLAAQRSVQLGVPRPVVSALARGGRNCKMRHPATRFCSFCHGMLGYCPPCLFECFETMPDTGQWVEPGWPLLNHQEVGQGFA
eukprot:361250-Chlamydomonas_euryale.AAC.18